MRNSESGFRAVCPCQAGVAVRLIGLLALLPLAAWGVTNTPGRVAVDFTTQSYGGTYTPRHFVAAGVTDSVGRFVKTLFVRCTTSFG